MAATSRGRVSGAAADVLGQLGALTGAIAPKAKGGGKTDWYLELSDEAREDAIRWVEARTVMEPIETREENCKAEFTQFALRAMSEKIFANKSKPSNPKVMIKKSDGKTDDHQFQFTMTDKFKYRLPEVPEGVSARQHYIDTFIRVGIHPSDAEKLVDNEIDFTPVTGIKSLTELLEGKFGKGREWIDSTSEEKSAGQKLAALLLWQGTDPVPEPLTIEEKSMVLERSSNIMVKAGFYDRVATYCQSVEQLMGIFSLIQPIAYPAYCKFAISDSVVEQKDRLVAATKDILGVVDTPESLRQQAIKLESAE